MRQMGSFASWMGQPGMRLLSQSKLDKKVQGKDSGNMNNEKEGTEVLTGSVSVMSGTKMLKHGDHV